MTDREPVEPAVYPHEGEREQAEGGPVLGVGLKTFLAGDDAVSLLEWRELEVTG